MIQKTAKGYVFLVGAGPGDPGLFTIKMTKVLASAEVVLYDYLVHPNFRAYCSEDADLICVGKKKGEHSTQQSQINQMVINFALQGKRVVRLKGGDPLLFGRGGEEMAVLRAAGIRYEVVPGISSTLAVPAYDGISLTHRDYSRSVAFVTGTTKTGYPISEKEYPEADTLVFLMAMTHLEDLVLRLQDQQRFSKNTPAIVIQEGTLSAQRSVTGTLETISDRVLQNKMTHPAILVVGEVARLGQDLNWHQTLPLSGHRFWVCRPYHQQQELEDALSALGAEVLQVPLIKLTPIHSALVQITSDYLRSYTQLIFTSSNAVTYFFKQLLQTGSDSRCLAGKTIISVGPKTAFHLTHYGISADRVPSVQSAKGILDTVSTLQNDLTGQHILIPQAKQAASILCDGLRQRGAIVDQLAIYDTQKIVPPDGVRLRDGDTIILMSRSQVDSFFTHVYSGESITCVVTSTGLVKQVRKKFSGDVKCATQSTVDAIVSQCLASYNSGK